MFYKNVPQTKKFARLLKTALESVGVSLSLGNSLDVLARTQGLKDWNALSDSLSVQAINKLLTAQELVHVKDASESVFEDPTESTVALQNGFFLKCPAYPADCDYVRVCDPLGREIAFWSCDEFEEAPMEVLGGLLGALVRGNSFSESIEITKPSAKRDPVISDVDFVRVHAINCKGYCFSVQWRELENLKQLGSVDSLPVSDYMTIGELPALTLSRQEDGFVVEDVLTIGELNSLKWNAKKKLFVSNDGDDFEFVYEQTFGDFVESQSQFSGASLPTSRAAEEDTFGLFLFQRENKVVGGESFMTVQAAHPDLDRDALILVEDEASYGPFVVELNGTGFYNEFSDFNTAVKTAKGLLAADESIDKACVLSGTGVVLMTFEA